MIENKELYESLVQQEADEYNEIVALELMNRAGQHHSQEVYKIMTGARHNDGKPQLSMVMEAGEALKGVAAVLGFGMKKYSRANWKKGLHYNGIIDSMLRHVLALQNGEDVDSESGLPHVDHITCNALFLAEMFHTRKDLDDRSKTNGN